MRTEGRRVMLRAFGRAGIVRMPGRRASTVIVATTLASGVLIGVGIAPALGSQASAAARQLVAVVSGTPQVSPVTAGPPIGASPGADNSSPPTSSAAPSSPASSAGGAASGAAASPGAPSSSSSGAGSSSSGSGSTATSGASTGATGSSGVTSIVAAKLNSRGVILDATQSLDIAEPSGKLLEVHLQSTDTPPDVGATVRLATTKLANGTLSETRLVTVKGAHTRRVHVRGVVSYVDGADSRYALSARGVSLLVSVGRGPSVTNSICRGGSSFAASTRSMPRIGQRLSVELLLPRQTVLPSQVTLRELHRKVLGQAKPPYDLAGLVSAVHKVSRMLTISADSSGISTCKINLHVPASFDLSKIVTAPPEALLVHAKVARDGSYWLTGAAPDNDAASAGSLKNALGDFKRTIRNRRGK